MVKKDKENGPAEGGSIQNPRGWKWKHPWALVQKAQQKFASGKGVYGAKWVYGQ